MVNFGPLAAQIGPVVWGTAANFNGFRVLAALLHGTPALDVSQTLRRWPEGATYAHRDGRAAITFGIGPHSSLTCIKSVEIKWFNFQTSAAFCQQVIK